MKKHVLRILGILVFLSVGLGCMKPALAESQQYKVCFVEVVDNGAFDLMMDGFKSRMEELGFDNVSYDVKNAQGDQATLNQIASQLKASDYDLIVPIATPAAQACVNANLSHKQVFISVTDPVSAGLLSSMDTPDKGITGTSDKTDCAEIYGLAQEIIPDLEQKTLGILFCSGEKNSQVTVNELTDYLDKIGRAHV